MVSGADVAARDASATPRNLAVVVRSGSLDEVREAVSKVSPVELGLCGVQVKGQTLLFVAAQREHAVVEVCQLLVGVLRIPCAQQDCRGQTALHYLARTGHADLVDLFVRKGCAVDHVDKLVRQTPLFYAARYGTGKMVRRLLDLGADSGHIDQNGLTPLFWAESVEACMELVRHCGSCASAKDPKGTTVVEWHHSMQRLSIARFLASCVDCRAVRGRLSWAVRREPSPSSAESPQVAESFAGYVVSLPRQGDVDGLCNLEDQFIEDHIAFLRGYSRAEIFSQIGLDQDPTVRRNTIRSIAQYVRRKGPTRHVTLKCVYLPSSGNGSGKVSGAAKSRTQQVVGYIYFRVVDGERQSDGDQQAALCPKGSGHIVVSHLKVERNHQRRGVAMLLLCGMLQWAEAEIKNFQCLALYLSVLSKNQAAVSLYTSLGFSESGQADHVDWVRMALVPRPVTGSKPVSNLRSLRLAWLDKIKTACGSSAAEEAHAPKKRPIDLDEAMPFAKRTPPSSPHAPSDISVVSTTASSVSSGAPSSVSQASSQSSTSSARAA
eukprot:TRINITY_DN103929_c0_g1_i1.p1 TRINITY_DN103929_c0_g1~~TRINITY_DN103929_c0_g1_i1.p1  ORF type:complete len:549 (+),score=81.22 TRINITY_DN103929_c0_g1_i1:28-1674(+)